MIDKILNTIENNGGKPYFVGGCVRDSILGIKSKDIDIEVFGINVDKLVNILLEFGKVDVVGKSFGVIKLTTENEDYDFSLPRIDNKIGVKHTDFEVIVDHNMSIEEAASRRDFTINSMSKDRFGSIIDPFNGVDDLKNHVLRNTSNAFSQDPLRVMRAFSFCGRFNLIGELGLLKLCRQIKDQFIHLPKERIWTEFEKWALKSVNHKLGLDFLVMSHWIDCFPELKDILGVPQDPIYHPEGCVYTHTGLVVNAMNDICVRENIMGERKLVLILSALCHDLGKANTTFFRKGRISAPGHDKVGGPLTRSFLHSINCPHNIIDKVVPLVEQHMCHINGFSDKMVRKLSVRLGKANIADLVFLIEADHSGRPPIEKKCPDNAKQILQIAQKFGIESGPAKPIVNGRDIIGIVPAGKDMGLLLNWLFEKQLEGKFDNLVDGLVYAQKHQIFHKYRKV
jgi:tRNA nucleotidyltransferase (CCA-adding enzyme)